MQHVGQGKEFMEVIFVGTKKHPMLGYDVVHCSAFAV